MSDIPVFQYTGKDAHGQQVSGSVEAPSRGVATVRLRQQDIWIDSLEDGSKQTKAPQAATTPVGGAVSWSVFYGLFPVTSGALGNFFEQLSGLYRAGVTMQTVVDDTASRISSWRLQAVLRAGSPRVQAGEPLSACMATYPQVFPAGVVGMVHVGELTGNLDEIARDLADDYHGEQRVWWALLIPKLYFTIVLLLAALVPSFPWIIQHGFRWWVQYVLTHVVPWLLVALGAYLLYRIVWHLPPVLKLRDRLAYYVPIWSALTRRVGLARFYKALQVAVRAGIDFPTAMDAAARAAGNPFMVRQLMAAADRMRGGVPPHEALQQCNFISPDALGMLGSASIGGTFDQTLPRMADQTRANKDALVRILRIGGLVLMYAVSSLLVLLAAAIGYLTIYRAMLQRAEIEGFF